MADKSNIQPSSSQSSNNKSNSLTMSAGEQQDCMNVEDLILSLDDLEVDNDDGDDDNCDAQMQNLPPPPPPPPPTASASPPDCGRYPTKKGCSLNDDTNNNNLWVGDDDFLISNNDYILGTLVVRVVAARNLQVPSGSGAHNKGGGLGDFLFGKHHDQKSLANPYASVRLGNTTQRTSECWGTNDPIWPRGEATMYMDVTHPPWEQIPMDDDNHESNSDVNNPGNPPIKKSTSSYANNSNNNNSPSVSKHHNTVSTVSPISSNRKISRPVLTVAVFHASQQHNNNNNNNNQNHFYGGKTAFHSKYGDSDDAFLGMASIDLTALITGKHSSSALDQWLPLQGTSAAKQQKQAASIRIVCEYETSDAAPRPGDQIKFTDYCAPADLFPAVAGRYYTVDQVVLDTGGDDVLISWTSSEGWVSTFCVHRFMLLCVQRHHSVANQCHEELASIRERIAHSPMVHAVQESVERLPEDGLLAVGGEALHNGLSLLGRWWTGGVEATARDLTFATNWDGRHNPNTTVSLATTSLDDDDDNDFLAQQQQQHGTTAVNSIAGSSTDSPQSLLLLSLDDSTSRLCLDQTSAASHPSAPAPLPYMPACPITGEPMRDPVVAADGHTYERSAIARWLWQSDKSPLTGSILPHKDLVPNYMLLSSLQEQAAAAKPTVMPPRAVMDPDDDEVTAEVNIDD